MLPYCNGYNFEVFPVYYIREIIFNLVDNLSIGKGMNPIISPPTTGRLSSTALVRQLVLEKENSKFKPVKLRLKIDLVS